jgi:hypothetical protein
MPETLTTPMSSIVENGRPMGSAWGHIERPVQRALVIGGDDPGQDFSGFTSWICALASAAARIAMTWMHSLVFGSVTSVSGFRRNVRTMCQSPTFHKKFAASRAVIGSKSLKSTGFSERLF